MIEFAADVLILVLAAGVLGCVLGYLARKAFGSKITNAH